MLITYDDAKVTTDRMVQAIAKLGYKAALKKGANAASSPRQQAQRGSDDREGHQDLSRAAQPL